MERVWKAAIKRPYEEAAGIAQFFNTFTEVPPAQRPASFSFDQIQERLEQQLNSMGG